MTGIYVDMNVDFDAEKFKEYFNEEIARSFEKVRAKIYALGERKLKELAPELVEKKNELYLLLRKRNWKKKEKEFFVQVQKTIEAYGIDILRADMDNSSSHALILFWNLINNLKLRGTKFNNYSVEKIKEIFPDANKAYNLTVLDQATEFLKGLRFQHLLEQLRLIRKDETISEAERLNRIYNIMLDYNPDDDEDDNNDDDSWLNVPTLMPKPQ